MKESDERGTTPVTRRSLRPSPLGHIWAWIVIAVAVVILMSITLWVVVSGRTVVDDLSGRDTIHQISERWRARWAQAPGPPEEYVQQAKRLVGQGDVQQASMRLSMALSLDANDANSWLRMVCLSAVEPTSEYALSTEEIQQVLAILKDEPVDAESSEVAHRWQELSAAGGSSKQWLNTCFGMSTGSTAIETQSGTLDTLPTTP